MPNSTQPCDILTIGSGPVGLAQTIHSTLSLRLQGRTVNAVILEKRPDYSRNHTVYLDSQALHQMAIKTDILFQDSQRDLQKLVEEFNSLLQDLAGNKPIADIESSLCQFASKKAAIRILKGQDFEVSETKKVDVFIDQYKPSCVIFAGGAHCLASEQTFGNSHNKAYHQSLGSLAQVKFVKPEASSIPSIIRIIFENFFIRGNYSNQPFQSKTTDSNGDVKAQVFISLDSAQFNSMKALRQGQGVTFTRPITVRELEDTQDKDLLKLAATVHSIMSGVQGREEAIVPIELSAYSSKKYVKEHTTENGTSTFVFKSGDASAGVPFQRSLCGSYLVIPECTKAISRVLAKENHTEKQKENLESFNLSADRIWAKEIRWARLKSLYVSVADFLERAVCYLISIPKMIFSFLSNLWPPSSQECAIRTHLTY
jgi:hypothetical protein